MTGCHFVVLGRPVAFDSRLYIHLLWTRVSLCCLKLFFFCFVRDSSSVRTPGSGSAGAFGTRDIVSSSNKPSSAIRITVRPRRVHHAYKACARTGKDRRWGHRKLGVSLTVVTNGMKKAACTHWKIGRDNLRHRHGNNANVGVTTCGIHNRFVRKKWNCLRTSLI